MTLKLVRGSVVDASPSSKATWSSTASAVDGSNGTYANLLSTDRNSTGSIDIGGFEGAGKFGDVPAGATINSVTVYVRHYETGTAWSLVNVTPFNGAAQIGTVQTITQQGTATTFTYAGWTPTLADLQAAAFFVRITLGGPNNTTTKNFYLDYVEVEVDYTVATPSGTGSVSAAVTLSGSGSGPVVEYKLENSFIAIANGVHPTPANSGGTSGDAFDNVFEDNGGSVIVSDTTGDLTGAFDRGIIATVGAASSYSSCQWILPAAVTECYVRFYFKTASTYNTIQPRLARGRSGTSTIRWDLRYSNGYLVFAEAAGGTSIYQSSAQLATDTIYRVELHITTDQDTCEMRFYQGDSLTAEYVTFYPEGADIAGSWDRIDFGHISGSTAWTAYAIPMAAVGYSDTTWLGVAAASGPPSGTGSVSATTTLSGSGLARYVGSGSVSAAATLSSAGLTRRSGSGSVSAAVTLSGTGEIPQILGSGTGAVSAVTTLSGSGLARYAGSGSVSAATSVTGVGITRHLGTGSVSASVALSGSGLARHIGSGSIAASVTLTGTGEIPPILGSGAGHVSAASTLFGSGLARYLGSGAVAATSTLSGSGVARYIGSGSVAAAITLTGAGQKPSIVPSGTGHVAASTTLDGSGLRRSTGSGNLTASVAVNGTCLRVSLGEGHLTSTITLDSVSSTRRLGVGNLTAEIVVSGGGYSPSVDGLLAWNGVSWVPATIWNGQEWVPLRAFNGEAYV